MSLDEASTAIISPGHSFAIDLRHSSSVRSESLVRIMTEMSRLSEAFGNVNHIFGFSRIT